MPRESSADLFQACLALAKVCELQQRDVAEALHDGLCQTLGSAALMAHFMANEARAGKTLDSALLEDLEQSLNRSVDEARHLLHRLQPVRREADGLMTALAGLAAEASKRVACNFVCADAILLNDHAAALALYRIAEAGVRHAFARAEVKALRIELSRDEPGIWLKISADGSDDTPPGQTDTAPDWQAVALAWAAASGGKVSLGAEAGRGWTLACSWAPAE